MNSPELSTISLKLQYLKNAILDRQKVGFHCNVSECKTQGNKTSLRVKNKFYWNETKKHLRYQTFTNPILIIPPRQQRTLIPGLNVFNPCRIHFLRQH